MKWDVIFLKFSCIITHRVCSILLFDFILFNNIILITSNNQRLVSAFGRFGQSVEMHDIQLNGKRSVRYKLVN